jgi:serine/threonine protein kinase
MSFLTSSESNRPPFAPLTNSDLQHPFVHIFRKAVQQFQSREHSSVLGDFVVERTLSSRGSSEVHLVRRLSDNLLCVRKRPVHTNELLALTRVIECSTRSLNCNIVRMERFESPNTVFLEFLEHHITLQDFFYERTETEYTAVSVARGILSGLEFLHRGGIFHGDIKPSNVMLRLRALPASTCDSGCQAEGIDRRLRVAEVKLIDMGSAAISDTLTETGGLTGMRGTVAYCGPEIIEGQEYGLNADIWSLGCLLVEMISKKPPWTREQGFDSELALVWHILKNPENTPTDYVSVGELKKWSSVFRGFLREVLVRDKNRRLSVREVNKLPWIYLPI